MRVNQGSTFFKDVARKAQAGSLLPAAFQRPYVWTKQDVLALLESILRGYPVGSFLIWSPYGKASLDAVARGRLGPVYPDKNARATSLLLDGQNRLASMCWLAYDLSQGLPENLSGVEKETWGDGTELVVDLVDRTFKFVLHEEANVGMRLPARALVGSETNQFIRKAWDTSWSAFSEEEKDDATRFVDVCTNALSNARVSLTDIEDATVEEALDAFLHICRVGVPMSEEDFRAAISWALNP